MIIFQTSVSFFDVRWRKRKKYAIGIVSTSMMIIRKIVFNQTRVVGGEDDR